MALALQKMAQSAKMIKTVFQQEVLEYELNIINNGADMDFSMPDGTATSGVTFSQASYNPLTGSLIFLDVTETLTANDQPEYCSTVKELIIFI